MRIKVGDTRNIDRYLYSIKEGSAYLTAQSISMACAKVEHLLTRAGVPRDKKKGVKLDYKPANPAADRYTVSNIVCMIRSNSTWYLMSSVRYTGGADEIYEVTISEELETLICECAMQPFTVKLGQD